MYCNKNTKSKLDTNSQRTKKVKDMGKGCKEQYRKPIRNKYRMRAMKTKIKKL
jgi:hypothetical protein